MYAWDNEHNAVAKEGESLQVVTFTIGEEEFAFDIFKVREIIRMLEVTKVPNSPDFIEGVINLRGNVIPIIDMRRRFNLDPRPYDRATRIVVVEMDNAIVGFIVDTVLETRQIALSCIEPPPAIVMGSIDSDYITGVAKLEDRLLILLEVSKIFSFREKEILKEN